MSYARRKNLTPYDVLIIASLIEREAMVAKERPLIASVIYNRLHDGIPLGIDATRPLRDRQLEAPAAGSPSSQTRAPTTRACTRACRPGRSATRACPRSGRPPTRRSTKYLFYVVKVDSCGEHKFAKTDAEFQAYVNAYNRAREARGGKSPTKC